MDCPAFVPSANHKLAIHANVVIKRHVSQCANSRESINVQSCDTYRPHIWQGELAGNNNCIQASWNRAVHARG
eukprot:CAMPEP_0195044768 /NCGR_PEP_ID=MMETSP0347-20130606/10888_1 /TAXON_ID=2932 /ORGANISM="Alexandrium fundyense, Strain CCMP1719" /LENGTH=72 /DNA_ID=CAMNT_0040072445 /DNA_START=15 /DNA_END=230 /DNA_ORIENTATION=-